jgi:hypothetical protein
MILRKFLKNEILKNKYNSVLVKFEECVELFLFYYLVFYWGKTLGISQVFEPLYWLNHVTKANVTLYKMVYKSCRIFH